MVKVQRIVSSWEESLGIQAVVCFRGPFWKSPFDLFWPRPTFILAWCHEARQLQAPLDLSFEPFLIWACNALMVLESKSVRSWATAWCSNFQVENGTSCRTQNKRLPSTCLQGFDLSGHLGILHSEPPLSEFDSGVPTSLPNACHPVQSIESVGFVQNLSKFLSQETKRLTVSLQLLDVPELLAANCSCIALITLLIRCGTTHQYTASPYNKLWQAQCDLYVVPNRLMLNI